MEDLAARAVIYERFARTGRAPTTEWLINTFGDAGETAEILRRLHDNHMIVLDRNDEIIMALPFSARPTSHVVAAQDRSWWANCAWDSLAIVAALDADASITSTWLDSGTPVEITITDGVLDTDEGFIHFAVPARHWWDDIVET